MSSFFSPDFWSTFASISTVLGFILVVYASFVALGQLREMTKTRHLEAMLQVYDMICSQEARNQRKYIYTELKSRPHEMSGEEQEIAEQVSVMFDRVGNLVISGLVPEDELMDAHCEIFLRTWSKLEPYIYYYRQSMGNRYLGFFEELVDMAKKYHSKHFPNQEIRVVNLFSEPENK